MSKPEYRKGVKYVPKQSIPLHFEQGLHYRFGHVLSMYLKAVYSVRSTLKHGLHYKFMCKSLYRSIDSVALEHELHYRFGPKQSIP